MDKFLDYVNRETTRIAWTDEECRSIAVRFLIDRVIELYVCEVFDDIDAHRENVGDASGGAVDVSADFATSSAAADASEQLAAEGATLDTADPLVIARYWLARWIVNIAAAAVVDDPPPGAILFRQVSEEFSKMHC